MHGIFNDFLQFFFPTAIPVWQALGLVALSFFTSFMSASVGIGGGMAMLGTMATVIPINSLIAVHALVQMGSNTGRAWFQRAHINWGIVRKFVAGGVAGAIVGGFFFVAMPEQVLLTILGVFILWMVWGPKVTLPHVERWGLPVLGMIAVFLSTMLGSTAALINSVLRRMDLKRQELIGTQSACVLSQHILKIIVFISIGVALREWLGMVILMIATGFAGTYVGTRVLDRIPEHLFDIILKVVLTLVALHLLWQAATF